MISRHKTAKNDASRMELQGKQMMKVGSDKAYLHLVDMHPQDNIYIQSEGGFNIASEGRTLEQTREETLMPTSGS